LRDSIARAPAGASNRSAATRLPAPASRSWMSQSDCIRQGSRHPQQRCPSARQRRTQVREHRDFSGSNGMHIVRVRFLPAELATRLTAPRFPAQRSTSALSDRSFVASIRISRISVPLRASKHQVERKKDLARSSPLPSLPERVAKTFGPLCSPIAGERAAARRPRK
jgi:hypothetical protein